MSSAEQASLLNGVDQNEPTIPHGPSAEESQANSSQHQENPPGDTRADYTPYSTNGAQTMGNARVFGLSLYPPVGGPVSSGAYEEKYQADELRQEMGPNARVWRVYLDEAEINDRDMVQGWRDGVDLLLVFAGLFSAVVTTFATQTSQKLDQDFGQVSASLLTELISVQRAAAMGSPVEDIPASKLNLSTPPQYTSIDTWVNGLWFTSLILSLATALFAVLIKQWIQHYVSYIGGTPLNRARIHQFRHLGLQRWKVRTIIGVLPVLLYMALFLFFAGLFIFLQALKPEILSIVGAISLITFLLYVISNGLPLFYPDCPYHTPLIEHIHSAISLGAYTCRQIKYLLINSTTASLLPTDRFTTWRSEATPPEYKQILFKSSECNAAEGKSQEMVHSIVSWLWTVSSNPSVKPVVLHSLGGLVGGPGIILDTYKERILSEPGLRNGLIHEFDRQWSIPRKFHKNPNSFIDSTQSYDVERIFCASLLVLTKLCTTNEIGWSFDNQNSFLNAARNFSPNLLLWYIFVAHHIAQSNEQRVVDAEPMSSSITAKLEQFQTDVKLRRSLLDAKPKRSFQSTSLATIHQHADAGDWQAWSNIYRIWRDQYGLYPEDTPITETYSWAGSLCRVLIAPESDLDAWRTFLPPLFQVLPPSLVEESFGNSLDQYVLSPETLPAARIRLRYILLSCASLELSRIKVFYHRRPLIQLESIVNDACGGLEEAIWGCQDTSVIAPLVQVLDALVTHIIFVAGFWRRNIYKILCQAGLVSFVRAPLWPMASHMHFHFLLLDADWVRHFWAEMFDEKKRSHLSAVASEIVNFLGGQIQEPNIPPIKNAFDAFLDLPLVQRYTEHDIFGKNSEQWPSHMQPLLQWMLDYVINHDESEDSYSPVYTFSTKLIERKGFLTFVCASLLIDSDQPSRCQIIMSNETANVLRRLAEYHQTKHGVADAWSDLLSWIRDWSSEISNIHHNSWTIGDFYEFDRTATLMNDLMGILQLDAELRIPRFGRNEIFQYFVKLPGNVSQTFNNFNGAKGTVIRGANSGYDFNTYHVFNDATLEIYGEADSEVDFATYHVYNHGNLIIHRDGESEADFGTYHVYNHGTLTIHGEAQYQIRGSDSSIFNHGNIHITHGSVSTIDWNWNISTFNSGSMNVSMGIFYKDPRTGRELYQRAATN